MASISLKGSEVNDLDVSPNTVQVLQTFIVSLKVTQYTYNAYEIYTYSELSERTYPDLSGYYDWSHYSDSTWADVAMYDW